MRLLTSLPNRPQLHLPAHHRIIRLPFPVLSHRRYPARCRVTLRPQCLHQHLARCRPGCRHQVRVVTLPLHRRYNRVVLHQSYPAQSLQKPPRLFQRPHRSCLLQPYLQQIFCVCLLHQHAARTRIAPNRLVPFALVGLVSVMSARRRLT